MENSLKRENKNITSFEIRVKLHACKYFKRKRKL